MPGWHPLTGVNPRAAVPQHPMASNAGGVFMLGDSKAVSISTGEDRAFGADMRDYTRSLSRLRDRAA